ncbi:outer membrane protein [Sphingomonas sp. YR710]|uniref:TolC family outer membrane protein n=1 Tax=Sphingomonas sp. YR710 TaxID=1882773 RepID=UPI00088D2F55|nr:TolC family outer membrane protein [Sphingomonas sp. YR710]SDC97186.1 outer membrane protein [Sphingomonas sp. YR710]
MTFKGALRGVKSSAATTVVLGAAAIAVIGHSPASADTLRDAFAQVYATNPSLTGARAGLRASDEDVVIARAKGLPAINGTATYNEFLRSSQFNTIAPRRSIGGGVSGSLPIFQGGQVRNSIKAADARVLAGRASLQGTESDIFTATVAAYMDVIRDTAIVDLNGGNVRVLETNLQASKDRFQVGDLTRTDVAQSDARLALAKSQLEAAQAQLDASRQEYMRIVGKFPDNLAPPPPLPPLPASPDDAVDVAVANNPQLEAARQSSRAADYDIGTARAQRLPRISAFGQGNYVDYVGTLGGGGLFTGNLPQTDKTATAGVQATVPLYQGGEPGARVRQAQARKSQALEQTTAVERQIIAEARTAFSRYQASLGVIQSSETAVSANELALEGVRAEQSVGTRNVLDVLNAEQELLNSRVTLTSARRDAYVAGFALVAAMGRAQAKDLGLDGGALYDPVANYKRVRGKVFDWTADSKPMPIATSTRKQPSVSAVVPLAPVTGDTK